MRSKFGKSPDQIQLHTLNLTKLRKILHITLGEPWSKVKTQQKFLACKYQKAKWNTFSNRRKILKTLRKMGQPSGKYQLCPLHASC